MVKLKIVTIDTDSRKKDLQIDVCITVISVLLGWIRQDKFLLTTPLTRRILNTRFNTIFDTRFKTIHCKLTTIRPFCDKNQFRH